KLREPRLPKLEPELEWELPARASASVGASVTTAHKNNGKKSRHFGNRLNIGVCLPGPLRPSRHHIRCRRSRRKHPLILGVRNPGARDRNLVVSAYNRQVISLIGHAPIPILRSEIPAAGA